MAVGGAESDPLQILVVCTANICRSVMGETALRSLADERGLVVEVGSAGFLFDGEPASDAVTTVLAERGHDATGHRSRTVTPALVNDADLVVTMERRHARDLSLLVRPTGVFTLGGVVGSLAALGDDLSDPRSRLAALESHREAGDLLGHGPDEIDDPYGRSLRVNRRTADRIWELATALLDGLYGPSS